MKPLFKPSMMKYVIVSLSILLAIKLLWSIVSWVWLPVTGIDYTQESRGKGLYYRVDFAPVNERSSAVTKPQAAPQGSISDIKLLAVYSALDFAVITVEYKGQTKVLSTGNEINGFVLEGAGNTFATFRKEEKSYRIDLIKEKQGGQGAGAITPRTEVKIEEKSSTPKGEIVDAGDRKIVDKSLIRHYATNMDDIFKDIGISDIKQGDKVSGFQVSFVRQGSYFAQLGLQRGDIIKSVNGQEMNSYSAAFGMYKNIDAITNLTMVIQRGNQEMELEYEVN